MMGANSEHPLHGLGPLPDPLPGASTRTSGLPQLGVEGGWAGTAEKGR